MVKAYGYYRQLLEAMKNKKALPVTRINLSGSRMSSKTFSSIDFMILACIVAKTKVYAFRYMNDDVRKLWEQILEIIGSYPGLLDRLSVNITSRRIIFPNGSMIELYGLHKQKNDEVKLTGLSGAIGFDYGIAFAEERYEIDDKEWSAVLQAIRGFKHFMEIHAANPWINSNDYVKYCNDSLAFDLKKLKNNGEQFKKVKDEIFHYSNYQINECIEESDKKKLLLAAKHDPHRANTILFGYPGIPEGAIWKHCLDKMNREQDWEDANKYIGCVDYGEKGDATAAYIIGISPNYTHAHIQHEYYWSNAKGAKEFKDTSVLAHETAEHFIKFFRDNDLQHNLDVFVDAAAIPFITALNNVVSEYGWGDVIHFYQSTKYKVAERVEQVKTMASFGIISVDKNCPNARREYQEATYSKKTTEYRDGDDHAQDAIEYGLAAVWVELLDNLDLLMEQELKEA